MTAFPNAPELQKGLSRIQCDSCYDFHHHDAKVIQQLINLLEVVKRIDSYTTIPLPNPSPPLPGFPFEPGAPQGIRFEVPAQDTREP